MLKSLSKVYVNMDIEPPQPVHPLIDPPQEQEQEFPQLPRNTEALLFQIHLMELALETLALASPQQSSSHAMQKGKIQSLHSRDNKHRSPLKKLQSSVSKLLIYSKARLLLDQKFISRQEQTRGKGDKTEQKLSQRTITKEQNSSAQKLLKAIRSGLSFAVSNKSVVKEPNTNTPEKILSEIKSEIQSLKNHPDLSKKTIEELEKATTTLEENTKESFKEKGTSDNQQFRHKTQQLHKEINRLISLISRTENEITSQSNKRMNSEMTNLDQKISKTLQSNNLQTRNTVIKPSFPMALSQEIIGKALQATPQQERSNPSNVIAPYSAPKSLEQRKKRVKKKKDPESSDHYEKDEDPYQDSNY
jgi:hypothetical protein